MPQKIYLNKTTKTITARRNSLHFMIIKKVAIKCFEETSRVTTPRDIQAAYKQESAKLNILHLIQITPTQHFFLVKLWTVVWTQGVSSRLFTHPANRGNPHIGGIFTYCSQSTSLNALERWEKTREPRGNPHKQYVCTDTETQTMGITHGLYQYLYLYKVL